MKASDYVNKLKEGAQPSESAPAPLPEEYKQAQLEQGAIAPAASKQQDRGVDSHGIKFGDWYAKNGTMFINYYDIASETTKAICLTVIDPFNGDTYGEVWFPKSVLNNLDEEAKRVGVWDKFLKNCAGIYQDYIDVEG